jgi:hypothetical protein
MQRPERATFGLAFPSIITSRMVNRTPVYLLETRCRITTPSKTDPA